MHYIDATSLARTHMMCVCVQGVQEMLVQITREGDLKRERERERERERAACVLRYLPVGSVRA